MNDSDNTNGVLSTLFSVSKALEKYAAHYDAISDLAGSVLDITYALSDKRDEIEKAIYDCEYDPEKQAETEERLSFLYKIKSKYGESEEEILAYLDKCRRELEELVNENTDQDALLARLEHDRTILLDAAEALSKARKETSAEFEAKVQQELAFLDMPNARIVTSFEHCKLNPTGSDVIEFLFTANAGESLKPLAKIASGGELSRIMLAIQNVLADKGNTDTMIFDEIDTGVSGSAAEKIAISLKKVSRRCQVICITHSAQVAAYADTHFLISKSVENDKTYTHVEPLTMDGRVAEVARIIGGVNVTELQLQSAREMLGNAVLP